MDGAAVCCGGPTFGQSRKLSTSVPTNMASLGVGTTLPLIMGLVAVATVNVTFLADGALVFTVCS